MASGKRLCTSCQSDGVAVVAKYRCPACDVASCSLACVKKHKAATNCSGLRNRAAPVRKSEYTDTHLMSDYTLMEDTARTIDAAVRTRQSTIPYINGSTFGAVAHGPGISKNRMNLLIKEATKRNISLRFMPRGYARHARNTSTVRPIPEHDPPLPPEQRKETRDKAMFWHLDIYFASCSDKCQGTKLVKVDSCEEEQLIDSIVEGAIGALKKGRKRRRSHKLTCLSKANDGYAAYLDAKLNDLAIFLRNEHILSADASSLAASRIRPMPRNEDLDLNRYVEIDTKQSLRHVLNGRAVVEFPILYVAFKGSKEASEIASAVSGIFEKPEESSGSGSSSDGDSEEEGDDDDNAKPVNPGSQVQIETQQLLPNAGSPVAKPGSQMNGSIEIKSDVEPAFKYRKVETSRGETQSLRVVSNKVSGDSIPQAADKASDVDSKQGKQSTALGNTDLAKADKPVVNDLEMKSTSRIEDGKGFGETSLRKGQAPISDKQIGTDAAENVKETTDSVPTEDVFPSDAASRGSGFHLDQPFTKESFKAILETRIPRKPRQDRANSGTQSSPAKLAASG